MTDFEGLTFKIRYIETVFRRNCPKRVMTPCFDGQTLLETNSLIREGTLSSLLGGYRGWWGGGGQCRADFSGYQEPKVLYSNTPN